MIISKHIEISPESLKVDGKQVLKGDGETSFVKQMYSHYELKYPKFHKMDLLCKLGVLASDVALKELDISQYADDDIALIFNNSDSSLESDVKHQEAVNALEPSPAVFVYTLANIVMGEISIRNKWYGEQFFTVSEKPDIDFLYKQVKSLFNNKKAKACFIGIINSLGDDYSCKLIFIENDGKQGGSLFSRLNLGQIINGHN